MGKRIDTEKLKNKICKYLLGDSVKEVAELIQPINDGMELIIQISNIANNFKLRQAWRCISQDNDVETSINVLYNYVSNQDRAFYISDAFKKIILSNSKIASSVIAYIVGEISRNDRDFTQEDVILYNALCNMTDYDIKNFVYIMDEMIGNRVGEEYIDTKNCENDDGILMTVDLCASYRIFSQETSIHKNGVIYSGTYTKVTKQSYKLQSYIEKTKQLLKYD